jgi:hypothetical protein
MQSEHLQRYTPMQQSDLNLVRMWLQVATLADMSSKFYCYKSSPDVETAAG